MGHFNPAIPYPEDEIRAMGLPLEGLFLPDPRNPGCVQPRVLPESAKLPKDQQERFGALYNDFFFHRNDSMWRHNAERKLPELLDATGMLACGEDLGMVPDCVAGVMEHETILSRLQFISRTLRRPQAQGSRHRSRKEIRHQLLRQPFPQRNP